MNVSIVVSHRKPDENLLVPKTGKFYQVEHDWRLPQFNYEPRQYQMSPGDRRKSLPSTRMLWACRKYPTSDFIGIHPSWQFRLYELFRWAVGLIPEDGEPEYWFTENEDSFPIEDTMVKVPEGTPYSYPMYPVGTLKWAYWNSFIDHRALTDGHAFNSVGAWYRDEVLKVNMSNPITWMMKCLTFTGNIGKEVDERPAGISDQYHVIEALDYSQPAPALDWILTNKPHLIWWMTEQDPTPFPEGAQGRDRQWPVSHFPQLKLVCRKYGLPEVGTPYFAIGRNGWNTILKADCVSVQNGATYSPYWPPK